MLHLFRIVDKENTNENKPVVYLQHGLMSNSDIFVSNTPSNSLAFILARKGYDVWLGNTRGTIHSLNHKTKNANKPELYETGLHQLVK